MHVRYSDTQLLFIKSDDKTCNMLLIATSVPTFFTLLSLSFYEISHLILPYPEIMVSLINIWIWQNKHVIKCIAWFPQRQYKIKLWAGWLQENLSTMYTKISCVFNEWLLFSIRDYGGGLLDWVCMCVFLMMVILYPKYKCIMVYPNSSFH